jgi:hypothetical protein
LATFLEGGLAGLNAALVWLVDLLLAPLIGLPALLSLLIVSVVTAVAMLPVIARTSNQSRIAATKRRIHAALFEIRLFNDDPPAVLRSLGDALRANSVYFALSLVPLVWMGLPLALLIAQLQSFYGYSGLEPGKPALLNVSLRGQGADPVAAISLEAPPEIRIETSAVRLAAANEVLWRIVPTKAGDYVLTVRAGHDAGAKAVHVSNGVARRSPIRVSSNLVDQFLYPAEPPLSGADGIASIAINYPEAAIDVGRWHVHWLIVYVVLTMVVAFALARRFGVIL